MSAPCDRGVRNILAWIAETEYEEGLRTLYLQ
jgi:hypothetical protein